MAEPDCTCSTFRTDLHSITYMVTAVTQPHAMVNDAGDVFYPDGPGDAVWFAEHEGARFLNEPAATAMFGEAAANDLADRAGTPSGGTA